MEEESYKNQAQAIVEEIRTANITVGNFRKYVDKVKNTEQVIKAQIENNKTEYQEMLQTYNSSVKKQSFKDNYDGGIVASEIYDLVKRMNKVIQETYGWKSIQLELKSGLLNKMVDVLGETKALDIERDALNRFNDMVKNEHEFFMNIMEGRFNLMEEKFHIFMKTIADKANEERKLMIDVLLKFAPDKVSGVAEPIIVEKKQEQTIKPPEPPKNNKEEVDVEIEDIFDENYDVFQKKVENNPLPKGRGRPRKKGDEI